VVPNQRDRVQMTAAEIADMLAANRKVQLATINPDGYPHLVTMYYTLVDGKIAFWTYRTSQKALNLARDPRISCLVETGEAYFDLRGVQIQGTVDTITDPDAVYQLGLAIGNVMGNAPAGASAASPVAASPVAASPVAASTVEAGTAVNDYVANAARKRYGYIVEAVKVISWDHAKLVTQ
jgi:PPOX class probable F420-dependent enzyme